MSRFLEEMNRRVLVLDGAMGTSLQAFNLPRQDYDGLENCSEILNVTRPDVVKAIHESYLEVGCDAVETNTFGATRMVLAEFGLEARVREGRGVGRSLGDCHVRLRALHQCRNIKVRLAAIERSPAVESFTNWLSQWESSIHHQ